MPFPTTVIERTVDPRWIPVGNTGRLVTKICGIYNRICCEMQLQGERWRMFSGEDGSEHVSHLPLLPLDCSDAPGIDRRIFRQRSLVEGTFSPFRRDSTRVSCLSPFLSKCPMCSLAHSQKPRHGDNRPPLVRVRLDVLHKPAVTTSLATCTSTDTDVCFKTSGADRHQPLHLASRGSNNIENTGTRSRATRSKLVLQPRSITPGMPITQHSYTPSPESPLGR